MNFSKTEQTQLCWLKSVDLKICIRESTLTESLRLQKTFKITKFLYNGSPSATLLMKADLARPHTCRSPAGQDNQPLLWHQNDSLIQAIKVKTVLQNPCSQFLMAGLTGGWMERTGPAGVWPVDVLLSSQGVHGCEILLADLAEEQACILQACQGFLLGFLLESQSQSTVMFHGWEMVGIWQRRQRWYKMEN